ncbi:ferredoxin [Luteimicrobium album]|uniref:Ferredoxin n=1 Tax=Luteimicrobium album TaxID=1054550 RepID=A0ABQ6I1G4_9MICO|nr:PDR/VanB family oxidoreductase [Luteimicrobium album]GMA24515.1 ferredoxin [Luteimicrobium album]
MTAPDTSRRVVVVAKEPLADDVVALTLAAVDGSALPSAEPGAHVDLTLPGAGAGEPGTVVERQYSLCGAADARTWTVAVLREHPGRGGSAWVHDELVVGEELTARGPRNHFVFDAAAPAVLVAGGIGITPILPMVAAAEAAGTDWVLHYAGTSRARMAFADELATKHPGRVVLHVADEGGRADLDALLGDPAAFPAGAQVYCCGPARLLAGVEDAVRAWPHGSLHLERFEPKERDGGADATVDTAFEVELELSGVTLAVPSGRTILETVEDAGVLVLSSCREGTCGTCETPIVSGEADHRDSVLTPDEQAENRTMMLCVSRAAAGCPRLVLEL